MSQENEMIEDAADDQAEQEEQSNLEEEVRAAFDTALDSELDEDEVKLAMISEGATFKNVTRLYNKFMIDAGLAISKADRSQIVEDTLEGQSFETEDDFDSAVSLLVESVKGATARSAAGLVRAYAKKNDLEVYTKPKGDGEPRITFRSTYYAWIVANLDATEDDAKAYIMGEGAYGPTSENIQKHLSSHMNVFKMTRKLIASVRGDTAQAA